MMTWIRRSVLALVFSILAAPMALADYTYTDYTPEVLAEAQASGKPVLVDFFATWCTTCRAQERVVTRLYQGDSKYNQIPIIRVDWDTWRRSQLVADWAIPRRSTLVLIKGGSELGRIVADTRENTIRALLDLAF